MERFFENVFSGIGITDIVDILIVAFVIYKLLGLIKQTRAEQLLKGVLVLVVATFVTDLMNLHTINWLLKGTVALGAVAILVVFQPELRRILERVGHTKFVSAHGSSLESDPLEDCVDKVSRAAGIMQESKTGALIVFERTTQLGEIIDTGTVINADPSVQMINNVFFPKSPLHDGAMIIRDSRLYAAGCILPLTQREDISSQLGTRHRAAIGMTENSDAVVLVVSEETGNISIVSNGQIERNFNAISARAKLGKLLLSDTEAETGSPVLARLKSMNPFGKVKGKEAKEANESENKNSR